MKDLQQELFQWASFDTQDQEHNEPSDGPQGNGEPLANRTSSVFHDRQPK